jgi:hypothetical protein
MFLRDIHGLRIGTAYTLWLYREVAELIAVKVGFMTLHQANVMRKPDGSELSQKQLTTDI